MVPWSVVPPSTRFTLSLAPFAVACGAPTPPLPVTAPPPAVLATPAEPPPPAALTMPTACDPGDTCTPPITFVDALCNGTYLEATLTLFAKGSPWTRGYLKGDTESWYASGGGSSRAKLLFDEEVLVLRVHAPSTSGVVVGNGATVSDVVRWDGLCYTVDSGQLTMKSAPKAKHPTLPFHHLSEAMSSAMLKDGAVLAAYKKRGKECRGVTTGDVTLACEQADRGLGDAVVAFVRGGGTLPPPNKIPGS